MQAAVQTGIESLVSRKAMFVAGVVAWTGGALLACAAGIYSQHHAWTQSTRDSLDVASETSQDEAVATPTVEVMPEERVTTPRPQAGTAEMQSR